LEAAPHTMTIGVTPINHAPHASDGMVTALQDSSYAFGVSDFGFSDADDSPANSLLSVKINSLPTAGTLMNNGASVTAGQFVSLADINAGRFVFRPAAGVSGPGYASFAFQLQDDGGTAGGGVDLDAGVHVISINVAAAPAPVVTPPPVPALPTSVTQAPAGLSGSSPLPVSTATGNTADDGASESMAAASPADSGGDGEAQSGLTAVNLEGEETKPTRASNVLANADAAGSHRGSFQTPFQKAAFQLAALLNQAAPAPDAAAFDAMSPGRPFAVSADPAALEAYKSTLRNDHWVGELNRMRGDVENQISIEKKVIASSVAVTGSVSIGYVMWLLRGGVLVSSLLSSLPAWHIIDPMPVLSRAKRDDEREAQNDDPLEQLFSKAKAAITRVRAQPDPTHLAASNPDADDADPNTNLGRAANYPETVA
ncbi:MAG: Ig-like domain-containing protein, partial [Betaproteobacteria bacterium]